MLRQWTAKSLQDFAIAFASTLIKTQTVFFLICTVFANSAFSSCLFLASTGFLRYKQTCTIYISNFLLRFVKRCIWEKFMCVFENKLTFLSREIFSWGKKASDSLITFVLQIWTKTIRDFIFYYILSVDLHLCIWKSKSMFFTIRIFHWLLSQDNNPFIEICGRERCFSKNSTCFSSSCHQLIVSPLEKPFV